MGKVKDEAPAKLTKAPSKGQASNSWLRRIAPFFTNFLQADVVKPNQGKTIRWLTAAGLAAVLGAGILQLYYVVLEDQSRAVALGLPALLAVVAAWAVFRIVQYPPFADFLIATEAEMNKVSWTSREDLYRATVVVLATVALMAIYLFVVDTVWSQLLNWFGVLRIRSSGFGSQAG